jgi:Ca2+-binding EF-hand superfamily protein
MLIAMGKCSSHDLDRLDEVFKRLDKNAEGLLNRDDLVDLAMSSPRTNERMNIM